nr:Esterase EstB [Paraburkholderia busanensis]
MSVRSFLSSPNGDPGTLRRRVDAVIDSALDEKRLVGAVVLVAERGESRYRRAAGLADRERARPMREDALFRLASISKPIVSTAVMVLVAQASLSLDDEVTRWLPEFRPRLPDGREARITVRQLLSHTAGLGYRFLEVDESGPYAQAGVSDGMDASNISLDDNVRRIASVPLGYAPGTAWGYSLAVDVLGLLIERVTGTTLQVAIRALVTTPLGMTDTAFFATDPLRLAAVYVNDAPEPHRMRDEEIVAPFEGTTGIRFAPSRALDRDAFASGGAGMVGTAGDFLRLLDTLRSGGGALLPSTLVDQMGSVHSGEAGPPDAPGYGFGLGFSVLRDPVRASSPESVGTWRWGGAYGHSWFVDRVRGLSVVAFTNTLYEGMSGTFVAQLRDAVYGEAGGLGDDERRDG